MFIQGQDGSKGDRGDIGLPGNPGEPGLRGKDVSKSWVVDTVMMQVSCMVQYNICLVYISSRCLFVIHNTGWNFMNIQRKYNMINVCTSQHDA